LTTTSTVSIRPDQGARTLVPGQSFHQNAIMAIGGSANVAIGPNISSDDSTSPAPYTSATKTATAKRMPMSPTIGWAAI